MDSGETKFHRVVRDVAESDWSAEIVADLIRSCGDQCQFQNEEGLTPAELALSLEPEGRLATLMVQIESENLSTVETFQRMLIRGNLRLAQILFQLKTVELTHPDVLTALRTAIAELRTRNVRLSQEIIDWVLYLLVEADYQCQQQSSSQEERHDRLNHLIECIEFLEENYGEDCFTDMDGRFVLYVRQVLEHVFFLKNWLKDVPLLQLQFCLSVFLRAITGGRNEENDIFGYMIDKGKVIGFLRTLSIVLKDFRTVEILSSEMIFDYLKRRETPKIGVKIGLIIQKEVSKNAKLKLLKKVDSFDQQQPGQLTLLINVCTIIHDQWNPTIYKNAFKQLFKTYSTAKQFYSVRKIISAIDTIQDLDMYDPATILSNIAALKRALQIIGEAIKSSKQTPNITKKLDTILHLFPSQSFVEMAKDLRQFFSHDYSLAKDRLDQDCPLDLFRSIQTNLKESRGWLTYVAFLQNTHVFRQYLGRLYGMKTLGQMKSYAKYLGMEFKSNLITRYEAKDLNEAVMLVEHLIGTTQEDEKKLKLQEVLRVLTVHRNAVRNDVALIGQHIDQFYFLEHYIQQDAAEYQRVRKIVKCMLNASTRVQRHVSVDKASTRVAADTITQLRNNETDEQRRILLEEIWKRLVRQNMVAVEKLKHQTIVPNDLRLEETVKILNELSIPVTDKEFVQLVNSRLKKYYQNLFDVNKKYYALNEVIKDKRVGGNLKQLKLKLKEMRLVDEERFQQKFDEITNNITRILQKYQMQDKTGSIRPSPEDRYVLEYYLLEITEILCSLGIFKDNTTSLKELVPVITGRNVRNYLAHDCIVYEVLTQTDSAVLTTAIYLTGHQFKLYEKSPTAQKISIPHFGETFDCKLNWINRQLQFQTALKDFNVATLLKQLLDDQIHIFERNFLNNDLFTLAMNACPETFLGHLLSSSTVPNFFQSLLKLPISAKQRREITYLLAEPYQFCFTVAVRFELIDRLQDLLNTADAFRNLRDVEVEQILRSYSKDSLIRATSIFPVEALLLDTRFRNSILHWSVLRGDVDLLRSLLPWHRTLIDAVNVFGETALGLAVRYGYKDVIQLLVENGANVNLGTWLPLSIASSLGDSDMIRYLINDSTERCPSRNNPLVRAVQQDNLDIFVDLVEQYRFSYEVEELLHKTIQLDRPQFFHYILSSEAGRCLVNSIDTVGFTPLLMAAVCGKTSAFHDLLEVGADPHFVSEIGFTALHCAVFGGKRRIIDVLLETPGVDINAIADGQFTPLNIAIAKKDFPMIRYLIEKGASVISSQVLQAGYYKEYEIARMLLDFNPALLQTTKDIHNRNMLMYAVIDEDLPMIDYLIARGIDVDARSEGGLTALHIAASKNLPQVCDRLIDANCDLEALDASGRTALVIAVQYEYMVVAKLLLSRGSEPKNVHSFRFELFKNATLLHKYVHENRFYMVQFLLDHFNFDQSLVDDNNETALDYARKLHNDAIIELLSKHSP